jgi:trimeric autotransporter adhesin
VQSALQYAANMGPVSTTVNTPSTVTQVLTNRSSVGVTLGSMTGLAGSPFSVDESASNCKGGLTLPSTGTCTLAVGFSPQQAQAYSGTLTIPYTVNGTAATPASISISGSGTTAPQGSLTSSAGASLSFGSVVVGQSANPQEVTVSNGGIADLSLSAINSTNSSEFGLGGSCAVGTVLVPGSAASGTKTCTVQVSFRPTELAARSGSLTISAANTSNSPLTLTLSGTGIEQPAPKIIFSPNALPFGSQTVGGLYPDQTLRITNSGSLPLSIASVAVLGSGFSSANASSNCVREIVPGSSCEMAIRFVPGTAHTDYAGSVQVTSNVQGSPHVVALTGRGTTVQIPSLVWQGLTGSTLSYGTVDVGSASGAQTLTLTNNGPGGARLDVVNAVGVDSNAFSVADGTCRPGETVLAEGASCTVVIRFAPGSSGSKLAQVQVASNGSAPAAVSLSGTGMGLPGAQLTVSEASLNFGTARLGAQSTPKQLTLTAGASTAVTLTNAEVVGPFKLGSGSCPSALPFELAPGTSCTLVLSYLPQAEGVQSGRVMVASSASTSAHEIALAGTAEAATEASAGGCAMVQGRAARDPTLPLLVLLALWGVACRAHGAWRASRARRNSRC